VGKLLEGKTPGATGYSAVSSLRILDPACGSGSFLIGAYQFLLDWYLDQYRQSLKKWGKGRNPRLYQTDGGDWKLTTAERKRILLNNIYGVDIDPQAVEVTKLSLLLKVLEGENEQTLATQLSFFQERVLPPLGANIKCGNSLIAPDFYDGQQIGFLDEEEMYRINVFDWETEFQEIMADGGFDAVIGNPPWGATFSKFEQAYLSGLYHAARGRSMDSYAIFTERALDRLKPGGLLGYITPDTFLRKDDYLPIRRLFLERSKIKELIETGPVFSKVRDTWCLVFTLAKEKLNQTDKIRHRKISRFVVSAEERLRKFGRGDWDFDTEIPQIVWIKRPKLIVGYMASEPEQNLIAKIETQPRLIELSSKYYISRGEEGSKYALKENPDGDYYIVIPKDVNRYTVEEGLRISDDLLTNTKIDAIYKHPKIWIIRIQKMRWLQRIVCGFDERTNSAGMKTLQAIVSTTDNKQELKYLQGVLSSRLVNFWCINYLADDMNKSYLQKLPICSIDFDNSTEKARHDQMLELVERMVTLNKQLAEAKVPQIQTVLQRQIEATDRQIDKLVYELYDLTDEEIKIVEGEQQTQ